MKELKCPTQSHDLNLDLNSTTDGCDGQLSINFWPYKVCKKTNYVRKMNKHTVHLIILECHKNFHNLTQQLKLSDIIVSLDKINYFKPFLTFDDYGAQVM